MSRARLLAAGRDERSEVAAADPARAARRTDADTDRLAIRLDWNESPLGPSPIAVERLRAHAHELHRYPRGLAEAVTAAVAREQGLPADCVLLTNGVDEAADLLMAGASEAWSVQPGFFGYTDRAAALGVAARAVPLDDGWEPAVAPDALAGVGPIFLDQPHNPTGRYFDPAWVTEVVRRAALVCLDLTYADFADPVPGSPLDTGADRPWLAACPPGVDRDVIAEAMAQSRLAVFHSFSKSHGLAGLRVGVLAASPDLAETLRGRQRAFTVDTFALHALAGTLDDPDHRQALRRHVLELRPRYAATLAACPLLTDVRPTQANFVLARGTDEQAVAALVAGLGARGLWVKDCAPLGLPGWLRVSVGGETALAELAAALHAETTAPATTLSAAPPTAETRRPS